MCCYEEVQGNTLLEPGAVRPYAARVGVYYCTISACPQPLCCRMVQFSHVCDLIRLLLVCLVLSIDTRR